jgi:DnaJ like chaperone protein
MGKYEKWILGGLGWVLFNPIGAIIGFAIGALLESETKSTDNRQIETHTGDFMVSLLVLLAAVLKADGKVMRSELNVVKDFLIRQFGEAKAREALKVLNSLIKQDIALHEVGAQINQYLDSSSKLQLMHLLFAVSAADGNICKEELDVIEQIAAILHLSPSEYKSIKSMFIEETNWAYQVLEIESTAGIDEIKKAYKAMAIKYHPDKVAYLGEDVRSAANEKFRKVNEAYEAIKKERGIV